MVIVLRRAVALLAPACGRAARLLVLTMAL